MQRLDWVGRVNHLTHGLREVQESHQLPPLVFPLTGHKLILATPVVVKVLQCGTGLLKRWRSVDSTQCRSYLLTVFLVYLPKRGTHLMHNALLHNRGRKEVRDRFGEACQVVHTSH